MAVLLGARPSVVRREVLFVCRYVRQSQAIAATTPTDLDRRDERRRAAACGKVRRGMATHAPPHNPTGRAAGGGAQSLRGCRPPAPPPPPELPSRNYHQHRQNAPPP